MAEASARPDTASQRRVVIWATASGSVSVLAASLLKQLPWVISGSETGFATPNVLILLAVAAFAASFALSWSAIRARKAPVWIWLGPAAVALWSALHPILLVLGYGWSGAVERLAVSGLWNALAPAVTLWLPSMRAAKAASPDGAILPAEDRAAVLRLTLFGLVILVLNATAGEIASGAFSTVLGPLRDDQAVVAAFAFELVVPFVAALIFCAFGIVPVAAWLTVAGAALAYLLSSLVGGEIESVLVYAWFLLPLTATVSAGCMLGGVIRSRFKKPIRSGA